MYYCLDCGETFWWYDADYYEVTADSTLQDLDHENDYVCPYCKSLRIVEVDCDEYSGG